MEYKIIISLRAHEEIDNAIDYYLLYSLKASVIFIEELENAYKLLTKNPFFAVRYKNIRAIKIKKFPYSLYFIVNESNKTVKILACFHSKRNPQKLPNK